MSSGVAPGTGPQVIGPVGRWQAPLVLAAAAAVILAAITGLLPVAEFAALAAVVVVFAVAHRQILAWPSLVGGLIVVILLIPIRRYGIPVELPFALEPYRVLVALVVVGWVASLLVDPRVRLRASGFEAPLLLLAVAVVASVAANGDRVGPVTADVVKDVTFLASFLLVFYLVVSVVRSQRQVDGLVITLVLGGAVVGLCAVIEARTHWNAFNEVHRLLPILEPERLPGGETRGGRLRTFGSAQHPIALGAALAMLLPLAVALAFRSGRRIWWVPALLIALGALATVSRTSVVMLAVGALVILWLRPIQTRRFVLPVLLLLPIVVHVALPGTMGSLKKAFLPEGGLVAEQQKSAGQRGAGRVADLGPALQEYSTRPIWGQGYGTRITDAERANADILDNQWLKTLLEIGIVGAIAWLWFLVSIVRRLGRAAKDDDGPSGWLAAALAASVAAFGVGMLTYDTFSFIQVTFLLFIMAALAAVLLRLTAQGTRAAGAAGD